MICPLQKMGQNMKAKRAAFIMVEGYSSPRQLSSCTGSTVSQLKSPKFEANHDLSSLLKGEAT